MLYDYDFSHLNRSGNLPTKALQANFIDVFETLSPEMLLDMKNEVSYGGLQRSISYFISQERITDIAHITPERKIEISENFIGLVWCVSYSLIVLFDETVQKPMLAGTYTGNIDQSNPHVAHAVGLFGYGISLTRTYSSWPDGLPNPERYNEEDKFYIERASSVASSAIGVILGHEFAHQYLGHLDYNPANKAEYLEDESNADFFVIDNVQTNSGNPVFKTLQTGVVIAFCSLLFLDDSLDGGDHHPDQDDRLQAVMSRLNLHDMDNLWGIASLAFKLWGLHYNRPYQVPSIVDHYKDLFWSTLNAIRIAYPKGGV